MSEIEDMEKELKELKEEKKTAEHKAKVEQQIEGLKSEKKERNKKPPSKTLKFLREWGENISKMDEI